MCIVHILQGDAIQNRDILWFGKDYIKSAPVPESTGADFQTGLITSVLFCFLTFLYKRFQCFRLSLIRLRSSFLVFLNDFPSVADSWHSRITGTSMIAQSITYRFFIFFFQLKTDRNARFRKPCRNRILRRRRRSPFAGMSSGISSIATLRAPNCKCVNGGLIFTFIRPPRGPVTVVRVCAFSFFMSDAAPFLFHQVSNHPLQLGNTFFQLGVARHPSCDKLGPRGVCGLLESVA